MPKKINKNAAIKLLEKAEKLKKRELRRTIIVPGAGAGDTLASGGFTANYSPGSNVSQMKWDYTFLSEEKFKAKHGISTQQAVKRGLI